MKIDLEQDNIKDGVLGLVLALVEIIHETLRQQAVRRMTAGALTDDQTERLGNALAQIEQVLENIKQEQGVAEAVRSVRQSLDDLVTGAALRLHDEQNSLDDEQNSLPIEQK